MFVPFFQVDAFTAVRFRGNPAAVMVLSRYPDEAQLQSIAAENNLAETAFLVPEGRDFGIRWFTPAVEVPLCGHATLASAAVVMEQLQPDRTQVTFHSASGPLPVYRREGGYLMDFPARPTRTISAPAELAAAIGGAPLETADDGFNYIARLPSAQAVRALVPKLDIVRQFDRDGLIVTASGEAGYDMVSRYFAPAKGIDEDPVTGGAHCALAPYWAERLGKPDLRAYQASKRGGELICRLRGARVELEGRCVLFIKGEAEI
jgi:PhzF family phenazine biosynthesis protein